ncbi:hypothetical protein BY458DRAFT_504275 [Sporodiniella umbellata]|nr:hypothetical protein BY458DRAFT_504275 [Sporodiniella umbellata]
MQHCHLALQLPEILSHIFSFLTPNCTQEESKKKLYTDLFPCLFVSHTWHHYASKAIWRNVYFEDKQYEFDTFLKFASIIKESEAVPPSHFPFESLSITDSQLYSPSRSSSISTVSSYNIDTPNSSPEMECKSMDPDYLRNQFELSSRRQSRVNNYCRSLRSLTLRKIKLKSLNEPLSKIGKLASQLIHLDIYICDQIEQSVLSPFLQNHALTYLSLAGCHLISDSFILEVAESCPRLEHLDLRACGQVSDIAISAIAHQCPQLRHLNVGRIRDREKITIKSIGLIAQHTTASVLGLAGCEVTDKCMELLAKNRGVNLERVSVNSCSNISNRTIYAFIQHCPNLSVFEMKECLKVNDWEAVAELVQRKVLLTLCDSQNIAFHNWARDNGKMLDLKAPLK